MLKSRLKEFDHAEEPVEDTEVSVGRETRQENTPVSTIAPTLLDTESADRETPACQQPIPEPCRQGTDSTDPDSSTRQRGEDTHVAAGLHVMLKQ